MEGEHGFVSEENAGEPRNISEAAEQAEDTSEDTDIAEVTDVLDDVAELKTRFSSEELAQLITRVQGADSAAEQQLLDQFEPVLQRIILKKVQPEDKGLNRELIEDLEQEGRVALLETARHLNVLEKDALSRRVYVSMLKAIITHLYANQGALHLPKATDKLLGDASMGKIKPSELAHITILKGVGFSITPRALRLIVSILDPISIDDPNERQFVEQNISPGDNISQLDESMPHEIAERKAAHSILMDAFKRLPSRWRKAMRWRYGFEDGELHTLKEVGVQIGVSSERVRQYEFQSLIKLKRTLSRNEYFE